MTDPAAGANRNTVLRQYQKTPCAHGSNVVVLDTLPLTPRTAVCSSSTRHWGSIAAASEYDSRKAPGSNSSTRSAKQPKRTYMRRGAASGA